MSPRTEYTVPRNTVLALVLVSSTIVLPPLPLPNPLANPTSDPQADQPAKAPYTDGRPGATLRMDAQDQGVVLPYGDGPEDCDKLGAREAIVFAVGGHVLPALRRCRAARMASLSGDQ